MNLSQHRSCTEEASARLASEIRNQQSLPPQQLMLSAEEEPAIEPDRKVHISLPFIHSE